MDFIVQYSQYILWGLIMIIGIASIAIFVIVASESPNDQELISSSQNLNINGYIRHNYKDINSY